MAYSFNSIIWLLLAFTTASCKNSTMEKGELKDSSIAPKKQINITKNKPVGKDSVKDCEGSFVYEDSFVKSILCVNYKNEYEVEFNLILGKKDGSCGFSLEGVAINKNKDLDPELDEDEEGISYPANEFIYQRGDCLVALRIAMKGKDKAIIKNFGCKNSCFPETSGLFKLVK